MKILLSSVALLSLYAAFPQVKIDYNAGFGFVPTSTTWTTPVNVGNNQNRMLIVGITYEGGGSLDRISNVNYGGQGLLKIADGGYYDGGNRVAENDFYALLNPGVGIRELGVTIGGDPNSLPVEIVVTVLSIYNAEQTLNINSAFDINHHGSTLSANLGTTPKGSLVIDQGTVGQAASIFSANNDQAGLFTWNLAGGQSTYVGVRYLQSDQDVSSNLTISSASGNRLNLTSIAIGPADSQWWLSESGIATLDSVSIGTFEKDAQLTVNGNIHSKEIKLDLDGALAPDYVFADDYHLRNLEEVSEYIKEYHHLPEIPSAKEMEESGLHIKEMNLLLLKKIEELTLHVIEQNRQIQGQGKAIKYLKTELKKVQDAQ